MSGGPSTEPRYRYRRWMRAQNWISRSFAQNGGQMTPEELERYLAQSGVSADTIVRFDIPAGPEHVRYVDLLPSSHNAGVLPDAVVESLGQPFAYVVRRDRLGDISRNDQALKDLLRILACRSDAKYLCVITPGAMDVFPV